MIWIGIHHCEGSNTYQWRYKMPLIAVELNYYKEKLLIAIRFFFQNYLLTARSQKKQVLPEYSCALSLASMINTFFLDKISLIRADCPLSEPTLKPYSFDSIYSMLPHCTTIFYHFVSLTSVEILKIISVMNKTTCVSDPFPTKLLISHGSSIIGVIPQHISYTRGTRDN